MNFHQSDLFQDQFQIIFHCWLNLFACHSSGVSQQFLWCFLSSVEDWRRVFSSKSWPFSWRFVILTWCHPLIIVSNRAILFIPIRSISELFSFLDHPKAIFSEDFFVLSFQLSFSKSYRCITQISSNQFMISSFSCIKFPRVFSRAL